ncbi:MAG: hypothetical protein ACREN5_01370, partial [Gemmatimonadales bacterium]
MLLPTKARYTPGEAVVLDVASAAAGRVVAVSHLGDEVYKVDVPEGAQRVELGPLPEGGYAVRM